MVWKGNTIETWSRSSGFEQPYGTRHEVPNTRHLSSKLGGSISFNSIVVVFGD